MFLPMFDDEDTALRGNNFFIVFPNEEIAKEALVKAFQSMFADTIENVVLDKPITFLATDGRNGHKGKHSLEDSQVDAFENGILVCLPICDVEGRAIMENVMLAYTLEKNAKHSVSENPLL